jgi:pyruvate dehydrogenase E2 component (dihydrolipoamide acetyltransferase)
MAHEIKMPQLSDTMHSGKILVWNKKVGDSVQRGDILAEVETDKANLEIESFQSGTLLEIRTPAGNNANVGEVICVLGQAGESVAASSAATSTPAPIANTPASSVAAPLQVVASTPKAPPAAVTSYERTSDRVIASPLAKKIAQTHSVDLSGVVGSGPQGRIVKKDVELALSGNVALKAPAVTDAPVHNVVSTPAKTYAATAESSSTPLSKMRETIARRMQESVRDNPHFYVTTAIRMEQAQSLRETLKTKDGYKGISINHLVIKACAYALENEPRVNFAYRDGQLYNPGSINIGIITAIPDGLLIPVIHQANRLSLKDIVFEAKAAVDRAKAGRPSSTDLTGGTFSISNMGMFDVENFTAIINPGQGGVIAISATKEVPVVEKGVIVPGLVMKATLSVDHRVIDGIMGANFLKYFKEALEHPALLMI